jgi:hypothetical protein
MDIYEKTLENHSRKGGRSDTIISWALTALSKLSIRLTSVEQKVQDMLDKFTDHMNVEIKQRACEFKQLSDSEWNGEREGIFEPMPFKGDENMTTDITGRAIIKKRKSRLLMEASPNLRRNRSQK